MLRLVLSCVWAALTAALCYAAVTVKAPQIEEDIRSRTAAVVAPQDPSVEVIADGRFVTLRGLAASGAAKRQHLSAAGGVHGALGPTDALWLPAAQEALHYLAAEKHADGSLTLSGMVPTSALRDEIAVAAISLYKDAVTNRVRVTGAADSEPLPPAAKGLNALTALKKGMLLLTPSENMLSGTASTAPVAAASASLEASQGLPWRVFVSGPAHPVFTAFKTPDGTIEARGAISSEAAKAPLLRSLGAGGVKVIDHLTVQEEGLPADWDARAMAGADAVSGLDWGSLSLDAEKSTLRGAAAESGMSAIHESLGDSWTKDLIVRAETDGPGAQAELDKLRAISRDGLEARPASSAPAAPARGADPAATGTVSETAVPAAQPQPACAGEIKTILETQAIRFDPGSAEISKSAFGLLKKLAAAAAPCMLSDSPLLVVSGHTDNQGAPEDNMQLSQQRAEAVRRAFAALGLNADAMGAKGFGESRPVADNATDEGRQVNRRIEFEWVSN